MKNNKNNTTIQKKKPKYSYQKYQTEAFLYIENIKINMIM